MISVPPHRTPRPCTIADALEVVGDRWSLLVVRELFYDQRRFSEIARNTGAPRDILATRLRKLEERGIIDRTRYSERPARYEYGLTTAGRALSPVLLTLKQWGQDYLNDGPDPVPFVHTCGAQLTVAVCCAECQAPLRNSALRVSDAG